MRSQLNISGSKQLHCEIILHCIYYTSRLWCMRPLIYLCNVLLYTHHLICSFSCNVIVMSDFLLIQIFFSPFIILTTFFRLRSSWHSHPPLPVSPHTTGSEPTHLLQLSRLLRLTRQLRHLLHASHPLLQQTSLYLRLDLQWFRVCFGGSRFVPHNSATP